LWCGPRRICSVPIIAEQITLRYNVKREPESLQACGTRTPRGNIFCRVCKQGESFQMKAIAAAQTTIQAPAAHQSATTGVTEPRARMALEEKGYSNVSTLKKDNNGDWIGNAMKGGKTVDVKVDPHGQVATR
jgi:hypothetical protein